MKQELYSTKSGFYKVFRTVPGVFLITFLASPLWATLLGIPQIIFYYVTFLSVFWLYKIIVSSVGMIVGYSRYKKAKAINWDEKLNEQIANWQNLHDIEDLPQSIDKLFHLVLIPVYKEPYEVLKRTFDAIINSKYDLKHIMVVIALEERAGAEAEARIKRIISEYKTYFKELTYILHPQDIPGEAIGIAGPNLNYAAQKYTAKLIKEGYNLKHIITTKFDSDTVISDDFFQQLTYKFLETKNRLNKFYSAAVVLYMNNYWRVPILMRIFSGLLSLVLLSEWVTDKSKKQSFSQYSFSLYTLDKIGYWDPEIGVDDTGFFWKAYIYLDGDFAGEEFYSSISMDAVEAEDSFKTHINQYKQMLRWGWGVIVFPIGFEGLLKNKKITIGKKLHKFILLFEVYIFWTTAVYFLTLSIPILLSLNRKYVFWGIGHTLPKITSFILTISMLGLLPSRFILEELYGPPPKEKGKLFFIFHYFEQLLLMVNAMIYNLIPYGQAQIEMMLGKKRIYYVTDKRTR